MTSAVNAVIYRAQTRPLWASFLFLLSALVLLSGCTRKDIDLSFSGQTMGTSYHITVVTDAGRFPDGVEDAVAGLLDRLDQSMSTYKPDSELNKLNRLGVGEEMTLSADLWQVLQGAQHIHALTLGAFDPTVGPLVDLWGFGPQDTGDKVPSEAEIQALMASVDLGQLHLASDNKVIKRAAINLDLSAIAKGYAAQQVAALLSIRGFSNYLVEVGGELQLAGHNRKGSPWRIAIEAPSPLQGGVERVIALTDIGVATSGDYRNYFEREGVRYSHTIDPRTGKPISHNLASVTVLADTAAVADALATAFMVMGADKTLELAGQRDIPVYLLVKTVDGFQASHSDAFTPYLDGAE
ncbi:MAG: FAD:protein FMN transferase [Gammaproteobacteria bacterium]|nr:FAD:protein FMN transferase [Gammaproteobacteria bacterium]MBQ0838722.1 FAD:protein FMN transferase [Gammaproteobacteria bacterium]